MPAVHEGWSRNSDGDPEEKKIPGGVCLRPFLTMRETTTLTDRGYRTLSFLIIKEDGGRFSAPILFENQVNTRRKSPGIMCRISYSFGTGNAPSREDGFSNSPVVFCSFVIRAWRRSNGPCVSTSAFGFALGQLLCPEMLVLGLFQLLRQPCDLFGPGLTGNAVVRTAPALAASD